MSNNIKTNRVYVDGVFDIFHRGHLESLKKAKEFISGQVELIVGIISDKDAESYKRQPIYNEEDRYMIIRSIKYVDEVIFRSPLIITKEFIKKHEIDYVVHGFSNNDDFDKQTDFFEEISDIFYQIPYYTNVSTTDIINKINMRNNP